MNLKIIISTILLPFLLSLPNLFAKENQTSDSYAITPENCGEMTIEQCQKIMELAKTRSEKIQADINDSKARIDSMHEEALKILNENAKEKKKQ